MPTIKGYLKEMFSLAEIAGLTQAQIDIAQKNNPGLVEKNLAIVKLCRVPLAAGFALATTGSVAALVGFGYSFDADGSALASEFLLRGADATLTGAVFFAASFLCATVAGGRIRGASHPATPPNPKVS